MGQPEGVANSRQHRGPPRDSRCGFASEPVIRGCRTGLNAGPIGRVVIFRPPGHGRMSAGKAVAADHAGKKDQRIGWLLDTQAFLRVNCEVSAAAAQGRRGLQPRQDCSAA